MEIQKTLDKVLVVSASQQNEDAETWLSESIEKLDWNADIILFPENEKSLPELYNIGIDYAIANDFDALIMVHDDVKILENPIPALERLLPEYGLIGVAGTSKVELTSPALWHIMGGGFDSGNLHGAVYHEYDGKERQISKFGPYPHRVVMIDGVFMAMSREAFTKVRFREDNPAKFHFYDLSLSLDCVANGIKVGVGNILINHASPGLREFTPEWRAGEQWFLNTYSND